jgi:hypothetical protein
MKYAYNTSMVYIVHVLLYDYSPTCANYYRYLYLSTWVERLLFAPASSRFVQLVRYTVNGRVCTSTSRLGLFDVHLSSQDSSDKYPLLYDVGIIIYYGIYITDTVQNNRYGDALWMDLSYARLLFIRSGTT